MKTPQLRSCRCLRCGFLAGLLAVETVGIAAAVVESWQSAPLGTYRPQEDSLVQIPADMGIWLVDDTASAFPEFGPSPNKAEILASGSDRYLKLTSAPVTNGVAENIWVVRHHLFDPLSVPITSGKKIAIVQTGSLANPQWSGYGPGFPEPNCTAVYMSIEDNRGNRLAYVFQRAPNYPSHTKTYQGYNYLGNLVTFGYHEIFLGASDAAGGTYVRDLFHDFSQVPGFNASGAIVIQIGYEITHAGTTTLRLLEIADQVSPSIPPTVTTGPAADVAATTARLHGSVNPNGLETTARFEYGLTTAYGNTAAVMPTPGAGMTAQTVSAAISGLQAGQAYHFRLVAENSAGTSQGADLTFTTSQVLPPIVTTGPAADVAATTATLHGSVNPNGLTTTARFEYGLTTAYGDTAAVTLSPVNGATVQTVSAAISGLQGGRTYHFRLTAQNSAGTALGVDLTFTIPAPPIDPTELVPPQIAFVAGNVEFTIRSSVFGRRYQLQQSDTMEPGCWVDVGAAHVGGDDELVITIPRDSTAPKRFYRLALDQTVDPPGFALISAGSFLMGDQSDPLLGKSLELPVHTVQTSAFYIGRYEVTKELWDDVRAWGLSNGYTDLEVGSTDWQGMPLSKGPNHPVHRISWYDTVKWCNARSQKEGLTPCYTVSGVTYKTGQNFPVCNWSANGYRLPTEAEWEKAARGGVTGKDFPWGDTINHSNANYRANSSAYSYDTSGYTTNTYHPTYAVNGTPHSSPVGSFAPNGYGLYDMAGNMWEWCWDWTGSYSAGSQTDPRGPSLGSNRVLRGGSWAYDADSCRVADRHYTRPHTYATFYGFRLARSSVP